MLPLTWWWKPGWCPRASACHPEPNRASRDSWSARESPQTFWRKWSLQPRSPYGKRETRSVDEKLVGSADACENSSLAPMEKIIFPPEEKQTLNQGTCDLHTCTPILWAPCACRGGALLCAHALEKARGTGSLRCIKRDNFMACGSSDPSFPEFTGIIPNSSKSSNFMIPYVSF